MSVRGTFIRRIRRGFTYATAKDRIVSRCHCETTSLLRSSIFASGILISMQFIVFSFVFKNYSKHAIVSSMIIRCNQCFLCIIKINRIFQFPDHVDNSVHFLCVSCVYSNTQYTLVHCNSRSLERIFIRIYFLSNIIIRR